MMNYRNVYRSESHGTLGSWGFELNVSLPSEPYPLTEAEQKLVYRAMEKLKKDLMLERERNRPGAQEERDAEVKELLSYFPPGTTVYYELIPNGYCSDACCVNRPRLVVTTPAGRIKVGWRKRVASISWEDSATKESANELFPGEDVTKEGRLIHAWTPDKAREYLARVIDAGKVK